MMDANGERVQGAAGYARRTHLCEGLAAVRIHAVTVVRLHSKALSKRCSGLQATL